MQHNEVYMAIEITSYSVKAIVVEYFNESINVLASVQKRFQLCEANEVDENMENIMLDLKKEITSLLGYDIRNTILVMPANYCKKTNDKIRVDAISENRIITKDEVAQGIDMLIQKNDNDTNFVTNVVPDRYSAYGYGYVSNPVGLETRYVEIEASIYSIPTLIAYPLIKMVENAGFKVVDVCLDIVALANVAVPPSILKSGAIIVDMNHESTNVMCYRGGIMKKLVSIDIGGSHITSDIALCANIPLDKAESFKLKYVNLSNQDPTNLIVYRYYDEYNNKDVEITQEFISLVAKSRVEEIIRLVKSKISTFNITEEDIVYFTSGGSKITGLESVLEREIGVAFTIYSPNLIGARDASFTKVIGAIKFIAKNSRIRGEIKLFIGKKEYNNAINLVEENNLLYNSNNDAGKSFTNRLVSYIFNN